MEIAEHVKVYETIQLKKKIQDHFISDNDFQFIFRSELGDIEMMVDYLNDKICNGQLDQIKKILKNADPNYIQFIVTRFMLQQFLSKYAKKTNKNTLDFQKCLQFVNDDYPDNFKIQNNIKINRFLDFFHKLQKDSLLGSDCHQKLNQQLLELIQCLKNNKVYLVFVVFVLDYLEEFEEEDRQVLKVIVMFDEMGLIKQSVDYLQLDLKRLNQQLESIIAEIFTTNDIVDIIKVHLFIQSMKCEYQKQIQQIFIKQVLQQFDVRKFMIFNALFNISLKTIELENVKDDELAAMIGYLQQRGLKNMRSELEIDDLVYENIEKWVFCSQSDDIDTKWSQEYIENTFQNKQDINIYQQQKYKSNTYSNLYLLDCESQEQIEQEIADNFYYGKNMNQQILMFYCSLIETKKYYEAAKINYKLNQHHESPYSINLIIQNLDNYLMINQENELDEHLATKIQDCRNILQKIKE